MPVVQEAPLARVELAVQVPTGVAKLGALLLDSGVAPSTTEPLVAVRVTVPQLPEEPSVTVPQVSEVGEATKDP